MMRSLYIRSASWWASRSGRVSLTTMRRRSIRADAQHGCGKTRCVTRRCRVGGRIHAGRGGRCSRRGSSATSASRAIRVGYGAGRANSTDGSVAGRA
jgi:hypothetical protein